KLFNQLGVLNKVALTSLFISAYLFFTPEVGEGIYWQSGAYTTLTPDILTFVLFGVIIDYYSKHEKRFLVIACLLLIAIIGCYEIHMVFIDIVISLIVMTSMFKKRSMALPLTLIAVCIAFSVFEITAPGNEARALTLHYTNARDLGSSLYHAFLFVLNPTYIHPLSLLAEWMIQSLIIGLLLFELLFKHLTFGKSEETLYSIPVWLSLLICISMPFLGSFICFWAEALPPEKRTLNGVYFYFLIGMIYFFITLFLLLKKHFQDFKMPAYITLPSVLFLLFLLNFHTSFVKKNNVSTAYSDVLSGRAAAFNREWNERYTYIENYKGDSCMVEPIKDIPRSFLFIELPCDIKKIVSSDMRTWRLWIDQLNSPFREYYHIKFVGLKDK
ncbi:MAG TPA: hypothetical protein VN922_16305, partial [Bacteroidia bacterium]|nr:hypothetical protein [Bacteroidia bacterium]